VVVVSRMIFLSTAMYDTNADRIIIVDIAHLTRRNWVRGTTM